MPELSERMLYISTVKYNIIFVFHELSLTDVFSTHTSAEPRAGTGHLRLLQKAAVIIEDGCGYNSMQVTRSEECMCLKAAAIKVSAFSALLSLRTSMCGEAS